MTVENSNMCSVGRIHFFLSKAKKEKERNYLHHRFTAWMNVLIDDNGTLEAYLHVMKLRNHHSTYS